MRRSFSFMHAQESRVQLGAGRKKTMFYSRFLGFPGSQLLLVKESLTLPCWSILRLKCFDPYVCHPEIEGLDRGAWKGISTPHQIATSHITGKERNLTDALGPKPSSRKPHSTPHFPLIS